MAEAYVSANTYCRRIFGEKVYKLALSASTSCPNRDGTKGAGGCIFCSRGGSGDFAAPAGLPLAEQIEYAKRTLGEKGKGLKYIAYFQSFTGTYGDLDALERIYMQSAAYEGIVGVSIATRPDCLGERELDMLARLSEKTTLWVELGLQTVHEKTAAYIRRGYGLDCYDRAMEALKKIPVHRITHIILGLPGESRADMLETVRYAGERTDGIKLQLLHVLEGTELADAYRAGRFETLEMEEYCGIVADAVALLPENVVIHRLTGDGAKKELIAPAWSADKKRVLNEINKALNVRGIKAQT